MGRLTITLDDDLHRALKETAARQRRPIGKIIEEGLLMRGIKSQADARKLVARSRVTAGLSEDEAMAVALDATRRARM